MDTVPEKFSALPVLSPNITAMKAGKHPYLSADMV